MTYTDELVLKYKLDTSQYDKEMARVNSGKRGGTASQSVTSTVNVINQVLNRLGGTARGGFGGLANTGALGINAWKTLTNQRSTDKNTRSQDKNTSAIDHLYSINQDLVKGFIYMNVAINRLSKAMVQHALAVGGRPGGVFANALQQAPLRKLMSEVDASDRNAAGSWLQKIGLTKRSPWGDLTNGSVPDPFRGGSSVVPPPVIGGSASAGGWSKVLGALGTGAKVLGIIGIAVGAVIGAFGALNSLLNMTTGLLGRLVQGFQTAFQVMWGLIEKGAEKIAQERGILYKNGAGGVDRLRQIANTTPGVEFGTAARASLQLQGAGADAAFAERAIIGLSNALLLAGGSSQDLQGAVQAFAQMASKGTISAEELNQQLAERLPGLRKLMFETFGTANAEQLNKQVGVQGFITGIIQALYKTRKQVPFELPEVIGRGKNLLDNVLSNIGIGLGKAFTPIINSLAAVMSNIKPEFLQKLGENIGKEFTKIVEMFGGVPRIVATIIVAIQELPNFLNQFIPVVVNLGKNLISASVWIVKAMVMLGKGVIGSLGILGIIAAKKAGLFDIMSNLEKGIKTAETFFQAMNGKDFNKKVDTLTEKLSKDFKALAEPAEGTFTVPNAAEVEIATNTRQMVELQQKAVELNKQLLGGGQLANYAVSPFNLTRSGAYAGGWEALMTQAVRAAVLEMGLSSRVARA